MNMIEVQLFPYISGGMDWTWKEHVDMIKWSEVSPQQNNWIFINTPTGQV